MHLQQITVSGAAIDLTHLAPIKRNATIEASHYTQVPASLNSLA